MIYLQRLFLYSLGLLNNCFGPPSPPALCRGVPTRTGFAAKPSVTRLLILVLFCAGCTGQVVAAEPTLETSGEHTVTLRLSSWTLRVSAVRQDILRLHAAPAGALPPDDERFEVEGGPLYVTWPIGSESGRLEVERGDGRILMRTARLELELGEDGRGFRLSDRHNGKPLLTGPAGAPWLTLEEKQATARFMLREGERLMGGGGRRRASPWPLDKRGQLLDFISDELGERDVGGGHGVPMLLSSAGYGLFLDNVLGGPDRRSDTETPPVQLDLTQADTLIVRCPMQGRSSHDFDLYLFAGPEPARLMKAYRHLVGAPILPERWFYGLMMSAYSWGSPESIANAARRFDELDMPLDAIIEDYPWRENGPMRWSPIYAAGKDAMFEELNRRGVRLGLHLNYRNHYQATDPSLRAAALRDYQTLLEDGVSFWWHDHGEFYAGKGKLSLPTNTFGSIWAANIVRHMQGQGLSRPVISRGGAVGGHRYIAPWPGDLYPGLDRLTIDLDFIRDGGLVGYAAINVDQGGFGRPGDDDNMIRRVAHTSLFFPVIRPHGGRNQLDGRGSKPPWRVNEPVRDIWRFYLKLRYRLNPYIYSAAIECHETMRPVLAPLAFDFPRDQQAWDQNHHLLLGPDLLVVPETRAEAEVTRVYLPKGAWMHYWTGAQHRGPAVIEVPTSLMDHHALALFVREGAMIPYGESSNRMPSRASSHIDWEILPPVTGVAERHWWETEDPMQPARRIALRQERHADGRLELSLDPHPYDGTYRLLLHGAKPQSVHRNGALLPAKNAQAIGPGWHYGHGPLPGERTFPIVTIDLGPAKETQNLEIVYADH